MAGQETASMSMSKQQAAMKLAGYYRRQGMNMSDAMRAAWGTRTRNPKKGTKKILGWSNGIMLVGVVMLGVFFWQRHKQGKSGKVEQIPKKASVW